MRQDDLADAAIPELRKTLGIFVQRANRCIKFSMRPKLRQWKRLLGPAYQKDYASSWYASAVLLLDATAVVFQDLALASRQTGFTLFVELLKDLVGFRFQTLELLICLRSMHFQFRLALEEFAE